MITGWLLDDNWKITGSKIVLFLLDARAQCKPLTEQFTKADSWWGFIILTTSPQIGESSVGLKPKTFNFNKGYCYGTGNWYSMRIWFWNFLKEDHILVPLQ